MTALDASALLAFMFREAGHEQVARVLGDSCLSTVNLAEVLGRFVRDGHDAEMVLRRLQTTAIEFVPVSVAHGLQIAELLVTTQPLGLSLGDRACLALAKDRGIPALTADRSWLKVDIGIEVQVIR